MMYNVNKTIKETLEKFFVPGIFKEVFEREYEICFTSNYTYYDSNELNEKIDSLLTGKISRKQTYAYINNNKNSVLFEQVIIDYTNQFLISMENFLPDDILNNDYKYEYPTGEDPDKAIDIDDIAEYNKALKYALGKELKCKLELYCFARDTSKCKELFEKLLSTKNIEPKISNELNIVCSNDYGMFLKTFSTNPFDVDIDLNYNDDFKEAQEKITTVLSQQDAKGIVLLSGVPGSGKTSFLRKLTQIIPEKRLLYIPPDLAHNLSSPDFITFLLKYPNSILFIEDAENIVKSRKSGGTQAVANLLNLSDGLLADALKIQVVCTFNCNYKEIDEALRRPGRLIAHYEFDKLEKRKAQILMKKLFPTQEIEVKHDMVLSEIYNFNEKKFVADTSIKSVGFKTNNNQ